MSILSICRDIISLKLSKRGVDTGVGVSFDTPGEAPLAE
jgi:hypothetical protein